MHVTAMMVVILLSSCDIIGNLYYAVCEVEVISSDPGCNIFKGRFAMGIQILVSCFHMFDER